MSQWLAGYQLRLPTALPIRPKNATQYGQIFNAGFAPNEFRRHHDAYCTLTVVGTCLATDQELTRALPAAQNEHWEYFMQWPGSYTAVVETDTATTVIANLAADKRVFFAKNEEMCWWSTQATPLAALFGSNINAQSLLLGLTVNGAPVCNDTAYEGVHVLQPGWVLQLQQGRLTTKPWYAPRTLSFTEGVEAFRVALGDSIARRAALGKISCDLSGGIDSSTIAVLAAKHTRVTGVTYVDDWQKNDDPKYAAGLAKACGIDQQVVHGDDSMVHFSGLTDLAELPFTDLPSADTILAKYNTAKLLRARQEGSRHHLAGAGGDCLLLAPTSWTAHQYAKGHTLKAFRASRNYARQRTASTWRVFSAIRHLAKTNHVDGLLALAREFDQQQSVEQGKPWQSIAWCNALSTSQWLTPNGFKAVSQALKQATTGVTYDNPGVYHDWLNVHATAGERATTTALAETLGMTLHNPFFDNKVIDACLSVPGDQRVSSTILKPLATVGFADQLPEFLQHRTTKGNFQGTMYAGIQKNLAFITSVFEESRLAQVGLLNKNAVLQDLRRLSYGLSGPLRGIHHLVVAELWLATRPLARNDWWEASHERVAARS